MRVDSRGRNIFVPQQLLHRASTVHAAASPASGASPTVPSGSRAASSPDPCVYGKLSISAIMQRWKLCKGGILAIPLVRF
jgi:hypothetical protein